MKKLMLVLLMVGASFAGGVVVNGPGLGWAKDQLRAFLDDSIPLAKDKDDGDDPLVDTASPVVESVPAAPLPRLAIVPEPGEMAAAPPPPVDPPPSPVVPPEILAADVPAPGPGPAPLAPVPNPIPSPVASAAAAPVPELRDLPDSAAPARAIPPRGLKADTARRDSTVAPASLPPLDPTPPSATVPAEAEGPWTSLRRRMTDLGVRRYWIEGQPGGPVTFRCVIPVAGKNAVAQHFEAEASDEFRAAEIVLRRVSLWKATESP